MNFQTKSISLGRVALLNNVMRQFMKRLGCITILLGSSLMLFAEDADFSMVTHNLASALLPGKADVARLSAEQASIKAEVIPEDPEVEFEYLWPSRSTETNEWSASISQTLPDFRKMAASRKVVKAIDSLKVYSQLAAAADARFDAEKKIIELIGARRDLKLLSDIHEYIDSLEVAYNRAWERGEVTILDLNKIRIEHARVSSANDEAEATLKAKIAEIMALSEGRLSANQLENLIDYPLSILVMDEKVLTDAENDMSAIVKTSPQFRVLEAEAVVASAKYNLASKSRFPQLTLGYVHGWEDGYHLNGISAGLTLPVYSRNSAKTAAAAEEMAINLDNELKKNEMIAEANADYAKASILKRRLAKLGPAIENTNNTRLLKLALDGGEISLLEYLQEINYFVEAAREYNTAKMDYVLTLASLARWTH